MTWHTDPRPAPEVRYGHDDYLGAMADLGALVEVARQAVASCDVQALDAFLAANYPEPAPTAAEDVTAALQDALGLPVPDPNPTGPLFVVRLYDGFDNCWMDVAGPMSKADADATLDKLTDNGKHHTSYADIDYYKVFPANTTMHFNADRARP